MTGAERARALTSLLESVGWKLLAETVQEQQDLAVQDLVGKPLEGLDGTLRQEYTKGWISRGQQLMMLPEHLLEQAREDAEMEAKRVQED